MGRSVEMGSQDRNDIDAKVYGPYRAKDGRYRCVISRNGSLRTVSYPRMVMEEHLGRELLPGEDVHHIDEDPSNNDVSNLEIVPHADHCRNHQLKYVKDVEVKCVYCGVSFSLSPKKQLYRASSLQRGKKGPFCSRVCSGKYGAAVGKNPLDQN